MLTTSPTIYCKYDSGLRNRKRKDELYSLHIMAQILLTIIIKVE